MLILLLLATRPLGGFDASGAEDRAAAGSPDWRLALPGYEIQFPKDHFAHPEFRTEWWYFTGHLTSGDGRPYGFQITFFRNGITPPTLARTTTSRFILRDLVFAHLAITDPRGKRFRFAQILDRGSLDESGVGEPGASDRIIWSGTNTVRLTGSTTWQVSAAGGDVGLNLTFDPDRAPVLQGENGLSAKGPLPGEATHYYSITRLATSGTIRIDDDTVPVTGTAWLDREWGSNQLATQHTGWDWMSIQLSDGSDLMLYQIRGVDGPDRRASSGTWVSPSGEVVPLSGADISMKPLTFWRSANSGGAYPIAWDVRIERVELTLNVATPLPEQELALEPVTYWEGLIHVNGQRGESLITGKGYLEMTGYDAPLRALQAPR